MKLPNVLKVLTNLHLYIFMMKVCFYQCSVVFFFDANINQIKDNSLLRDPQSGNPVNLVLKG